MKKKIYIFIVIICILIAILGTIFITKSLDYEAKLIQLSATHNDRMMGYIMLTKNGKVIVIDGGNYEDGANLENYLSKYGNKVDLWILTHFHRDHTGAFRYIVEKGNVEISSIYNSLNTREKVEENELVRLDDFDKFYSAITDDKIKSVVHEARVGEIINIDDIEIKILGVKNEDITNNFGNNQSMVTKFTMPSKTTVLFLGDTGLESEEKLKSSFYNELDSDYVQMAHHGQAGVSEEMYNIILPKYCLWPTTLWIWNNDVGEGYNTGELKTIETRSWIEKIGAKNYVALDEDKVIKIK